jgi:hypothetical protein
MSNTREKITDIEIIKRINDRKREICNENKMVIPKRLEKTNDELLDEIYELKKELGVGGAEKTIKGQLEKTVKELKQQLIINSTNTALLENLPSHPSSIE